MLTTIQSESFVGLNSISYLGMSFNFVITIVQNAFKGLNNLKDLNLSNNHFTEIEDFMNLPNLESINLDFNKINRIKENTFTSLTNNVSISLRFNKIKEINEDEADAVAYLLMFKSRLDLKQPSAGKRCGLAIRIIRLNCKCLYAWSF